jgi:hypothetical protein
LRAARRGVTAEGRKLKALRAPSPRARGDDEVTRPPHVTMSANDPERMFARLGLVAELLVARDLNGNRRAAAVNIKEIFTI